jgi:hypothetical protein
VVGKKLIDAATLVHDKRPYFSYFVPSVLTDKTTDVWSRDLMIWKINFGLGAVAWAGLWNKRVWADYEQLLRPAFSLFRGQIFFF